MSIESLLKIPSIKIGVSKKLIYKSSNYAMMDR